MSLLLILSITLLRVRQAAPIFEVNRNWYDSSVLETMKNQESFSYSRLSKRVLELGLKLIKTKRLSVMEFIKNKYRSLC